MELRTHHDIGAIKTPIGFLPKYKDLQKLFKQIINKDYTEQDYEKQFSLRVVQNIDKIKRIISIYNQQAPDAPSILFEVLAEQEKRLQQAREKFGDYIPPSAFENS